MTQEKKRGDGANQSKLCLRFSPQPGSPGFGGDWLAMPYHALEKVRGAPDFSRFAVHYIDGSRVIVEGHNLKPLADKLEAGKLGEVMQAEPMELQEAQHCVTVSVRGDELEALLQLVRGFRTAKVEGVETQAAGKREHYLVTGLRLEEPEEER